MRTTRRKLLKNTSTAAGLTILPCASMVNTYAANERLHLAVYGTMYNFSAMAGAGETYGTPIVAIGDPDTRKLEKAFKRWGDTAKRLAKAKKPESRAFVEHFEKLSRGEAIQTFADVRVLFDKMGDSFDALVVSNYDHFHGVCCGPALRSGKPVLSERPLGMNISDARRLRELAGKTGLPTTYRSPGTTSGQFRRAIELVEDGLLGAISEVHIWFKRGGPNRLSLPEGTDPVPESLNWDAWLGPLPERPFHSQWLSYANWRENCNGGLGSFGPHTTIFPFLVLNIGDLWEQQLEIEVSAECSHHNLISFPKWERVRWEIPSRRGHGAVTMTWHHGPDYAPGARELIHGKLKEFGVPTADDADRLMANAGTMIIGSNGALVGSDHSSRITVLPEDRFAATETDQPQRIKPGKNIYRDWIDACRGGTDPHILADFTNGGRLSELLMAGNMATRFPEETLTYHTAKGEFTNKPEANAFLGFDYRDGWEL